MDEKISKDFYCAVRRNPEGTHWFDTTTIHLLYEEVERNIVRSNASAKQFSISNPVVGIAKVVVELKEFYAKQKG